MANLKDLLDKVKQEQEQHQDIKKVAEMEDYEGEESYGEEYEGSVCYYLNEDGTCSDGCSCAEVEIEQECPFMSSGDYESCCCYEEAYYDDSGEESEEEEYEEDSERNEYEE